MAWTSKPSAVCSATMTLDSHSAPTPTPQGRSKTRPHKRWAASWRRSCEQNKTKNTGEKAKASSPVLFKPIRVWVRVWVRRLTHILTHTIFSVFATKKHRKPKFSMLFGAGGVTRTHDLLITKCIGVLRLTVFRDFGAFPLGILREVRPILSIVFVRSFPRVGLGVGQTDTSASKKPRMGFAVIFRLAVSLS